MGSEPSDDGLRAWLREVSLGPSTLAQAHRNMPRITELIERLAAERDRLAALVADGAVAAYDAGYAASARDVVTWLRKLDGNWDVPNAIERGDHREGG